MALAFEQADVRVVADDDVKVAKRAGFFKKSHMAGVKPVETAGDDVFFSSGNRSQGRRFGKPIQLVSLEHAVVDLVFESKLFAGGTGRCLDVRPDVRLPTRWQRSKTGRTV